VLNFTYTLKFVISSYAVSYTDDIHPSRVSKDTDPFPMPFYGFSSSPLVQDGNIHSRDTDGVAMLPLCNST
jgi:hypothetical protein